MPESFHFPKSKQEQAPSSFETWLASEFPKQYREKMKILDRLGLFQILPESGMYGIVDISGVERPVPEESAIREELLKNKEFFEKKMKQGFTELSVTPFGLPLSQLLKTAKKAILKHHTEGNLFSRDKDGTRVPIELNRNADGTYDPMYVWEKYAGADLDGSLKNFSTSFTKDHHGGRTKQQVLEENNPYPGFLVSFTEEGPIPRKGKGVTKEGRKQLEAGQSSNQYLEMLQTNETYQGESGITIEEWLTTLLTHLEATGEVIDDYQGNGSGSWNLGSYFPAAGHVSYAFWNRDYGRAGGDGFDPSDEYDGNGSRSAVRVGFEI